MSSALKKETLKGVVWMTLGTGGQQVSSFIIMMVLARLLGPQAYGVVGIASVLLEILNYIGRAGLPEVLVQRSNPTQDDLSTAFWTSFLFGSLLTLLLYLSAPALALIFHEPQLERVIQFMAPSCLLSAISAVQEALLRRTFQFKSFALRNVTATTLGGITAIIMAVNGFGVMSLVAQRLVLVTYLTASLWYIVKWVPNPTFSIATARGQLKDGSIIAGASLLGSGNQRLIDLIIGYFLGTVALGYMRIAWRGLDLLLDLSIRPMSNVIFSSFAKLQDDKEALERAYLRIIQLAAIFSLPLFLGTGLIAPEFITLLFGAQWQPSVILMQILTLTSFFVPLLYFRPMLFIATGRMKEVLYLHTIEFLIGVGATIVFCQFGIEGAAAGNVVRMAVATPVILYYVQKYTGISARATLKKVTGPVTAALFMTSSLFLFRTSLPASAQGLPLAAALVVLGAMIYVSILYLGFRPSTLEAQETMLSVLPPRISALFKKFGALF